MKAVQYSFSRGLMDRRLENRVDTGLPQQSLIGALNVIINPFGTVSRRPGTKFFGDTGLVLPEGTKANSCLFRMRIAHAKIADEVVEVSPEDHTDYPVFDFFSYLSSGKYCTFLWAESPPLTWTATFESSDSFINPQYASVQFSTRDAYPYVTSPKNFIGFTDVLIDGIEVLDRTFLAGNANGAGADDDVSAEWAPDASCFFEDRYWVMIGNTLYGSEVGNYSDFTRTATTTETDGVQYTLSRFEGNVAKWMTSVAGRLIIGYDTCEVVMTPPSRYHATSGGDPAGTPSFEIFSTTGSSTPRVAALPNGFIHENGGKLYAKQLQSDLTGWQTRVLNPTFDLTGLTISDIQVQEYPFRIIWIITNTGEVFSLTLSSELGVEAWAKHTFTAGSDEVVGICISPPLSALPNQHTGSDTPEIESYSNPKQVLYIAVRRGSSQGKLTIEWLDLSEIDTIGVVHPDTGLAIDVPYLDCRGFVNDPTLIDTNIWGGGVGIDGLGNVNQIVDGVAPSWEDPTPENPGAFTPWVIGFEYDSRLTLPKPITGPVVGEKMFITKAHVEIQNAIVSTSDGTPLTAFDIGFEGALTQPDIDESNRFNAWIQDRRFSEAEKRGLVIRDIKSDDWSRNVVIQSVEQFRMDIYSVVLEVNPS